MKLLVVVILCALAATVQSALSKEEEIAAFRAIATTCKEATGATDADIESMMRYEPAASMEAKCLIACILKKINVMDANGKLVKEVVMKFAEAHTKGDPTKMKIAGEIMDVCKDFTVSDNHCEAAEQYGLCMRDEAAKRGINIVEL